MAIGRSLVQRIRVFFLGCTTVLATFLASPIHAQDNLILQQRVATLMANEREAAKQKPPFLYTSIERSDRTRGHLWTERVVEIPQGKLRYLIAEDGNPLSVDRRNAEIARLKTIADDPDEFIRHEQTRKNDGAACPADARTPSPSLSL
jgi:hypothetical protein